MCQNLQVQVKELKSVNESLNLSVEELYKARALAEATLRERNEMISTKYEKYFASKETENLTDEIKSLQTENQILKSRESELINLEKFKFLKHDTSLKKMIEMIEKEYESNVSKISITSSTFETKNLKLVKEMGDKVKCFDEEKKTFETKIAKWEKLASQNYTSLQKENNDLRTSYNVLKEKYETSYEQLEKENNDLKMHYKRLFDSIKQKKVDSQVFTKSIPKVNDSKKIHVGKSSKPISRKVSQFTTYSLQKDKKYLKKQQSSETFSSQNHVKNKSSKQAWKRKENISKPLKYSRSEVFSMRKRDDFVLKKVKDVRIGIDLPRSLLSNLGKLGLCDGVLDVVIGAMTIKKVYFVEDGVDLLTGVRSSNLYTITLNEIASNSLACLLAKASSSQSWLWHQRLSHLNFATINNLVKNNLVRGLPKMKFKKDHLCSACEQGKLHQKHHKSKMDFALNKPFYRLHMDLCGPMRVKSINGKRYVLVVVDDYSRYTWVFFLHSKDEASEVIISFIKKTQVNLQLQVQCVQTDNWYLSDIEVFIGYSKESAAFRVYNKRTRKIHESVNVNFDEILETSSKQFCLEPGLSNLNETRKSSNPTVSQVLEILKKDLDDLFYNFYDEYFDSSKITKSSTTNVETSNNEILSHEREVFHEVSESFQEESSSSSLNDDVQHKFRRIFIEPANVAGALKDADWVSAMQDELDQFARLKVWRLVPRPEGKTVIKTRWIFKNKKDESSLVIQTKGKAL
ncbi:retrovirus-related pol polyprotein from transposon TNT 1-94 [Tanacetum coccineum]